MNYEETKDAVKGVKSGETCAFHPFDGAFAVNWSYLFFFFAG